MALSRKEVDEIKPWLKDTVKKRLGYSEKSVVNAALQCLQNELDKDTACKELTSLLDDLAPRFVDDLFSKLDRIRRPKSSNRSNSSKKRTLEDVFGDSRDNDEETRDESETLKKRKKTRSSNVLTDPRQMLVAFTSTLVWRSNTFNLGVLLKHLPIACSRL